MTKKVELLAEVEQLFGVVRDAWAEMLRTHNHEEAAVGLAAR
jgi:flagellin-specific chaperone FliS